MRAAFDAHADRDFLGAQTKECRLSRCWRKGSLGDSMSRLQRRSLGAGNLLVGIRRRIPTFGPRRLFGRCRQSALAALPPVALSEADESLGADDDVIENRDAA